MEKTLHLSLATQISLGNHRKRLKSQTTTTTTNWIKSRLYSYAKSLEVSKSNYLQCDYSKLYFKSDELQL